MEILTKKLSLNISLMLRESSAFLRLKTLVCVWFLLSGIHQVLQAQIVNTATEKAEYLLIGDAIGVFWDSTGSKQAKDFENGRLSQQFKPAKGELSNRNRPKGVYWVKFTIEHPSPEQWLLELPDPHVDFVDLYVLDSGIVKSIGRLGHALPFANRNYEHKNLVFSLPVKSKQAYLMRIESRMISSYMIILKRPDKFTSYALWEYYMLGLYYGVLMIMVLYNLFLYFNLREKNYLLYVFYVVSCGLYTFREDGIGFQYLWPELPALNVWLNHYFELILLLSFTFYSVCFLELRSKARNVYYILVAVIVTYATLTVLEFFIEGIQPPKQYLYIFPFILLYGVSFHLYRKGKRYLIYYQIAYSFLLISVFIFQARRFGLVDHTFFTVYIFNFGFLVEIVLMSFALGEKIRLSTTAKEEAQHIAFEALKEKEQAQAKVVEQMKEKEELKDRINKELERKVQERTIELAQKNGELEDNNQKLALLSARLEEMNSSLDKDNWELNKEVKQKTLATIAGDEISQEDFMHAFPNETACLLYLSELKWKDGYICQKCGNTKYNQGDTPLSRKCSKCNHRESPTAGTLFHGIKTELNKAFYITYLSVVNPKKYTLEALSERLDLGMNTCWKIRKKVTDKRKEMEAKELPVNKWENYLL